MKNRREISIKCERWGWEAQKAFHVRIEMQTSKDISHHAVLIQANSLIIRTRKMLFSEDETDRPRPGENNPLRQSELAERFFFWFIGKPPWKCFFPNILALKNLFLFDNISRFSISMSERELELIHKPEIAFVLRPKKSISAPDFGCLSYYAPKKLLTN